MFGTDVSIRDKRFNWHVPGRAYFVLKLRLSNEGLNDRNTLPSIVTFPEMDFQHHVVRQL